MKSNNIPAHGFKNEKEKKVDISKMAGKSNSEMTNSSNMANNHTANSHMANSQMTDTSNTTKIDSKQKNDNEGGGRADK